MAWSPWRWLSTTYRTGSSVISSRICRIRAFAAEGFEWVSTTRTWSRLTMTAALQFSMAVGLAIARVDPVGDLLEVEEPGRGGAARGRMDVVGERPDESSPGKPLAAATSPASFSRLNISRRLVREGPVARRAGGWGWSEPP